MARAPFSHQECDWLLSNADFLAALLAWRSDLTDVQALQEQTGGGGPIARNAARHTAAMTGLAAEQRLNERVAALDRGAS